MDTCLLFHTRVYYSWIVDLRSPAAAVLPALRARVLMVLARADAALTGRTVASLADGSVAGVAKVLAALVAGGLVERTDVGSASLYALNRNHLAAPAVETLANMRTNLFTRMHAHIAEFTHQPLNATVFGSVARGDGTADSDIDILLVRPLSVDEDDAAWADDAEQLGRLVLAWTGNPLNVIDYGPREITPDSPQLRALLDSIESEGVLVHGAELRLLRRRVQTLKPG